MDTNYLLQREQVALMMAQRARGAEARSAHRWMAQAYGRLLTERSYPHRAFTVPWTVATISARPDAVHG